MLSGLFVLFWKAREELFATEAKEWGWGVLKENMALMQPRHTNWISERTQ